MFFCRVPAAEAFAATRGVQNFRQWHHLRRWPSCPSLWSCRHEWWVGEWKVSATASKSSHMVAMDLTMANVTNVLVEIIGNELVPGLRMATLPNYLAGLPMVSSEDLCVWTNPDRTWWEQLPVRRGRRWVFKAVQCALQTCQKGIQR